jgi:spore coat protein CotH
MKRILPVAILVLALIMSLGVSKTPVAASRSFFDEPQFGMPPGGFGGPEGGEIKLVNKFDKNGNQRLDKEERKAARDYLKSSQAQGGFGRPGGGRTQGFGGRGGFGASAQPGAKISPADVKSGGDAALYDPNTLRTLFFQFEDADWEQEMEDFYGTDVEVPATMIVDGKTYRDVGIHFRGNTSYSMVPSGMKRSLNVSLDFAHKSQNLGGYRTLNLLNSNADPTFLHSVLYLQIAREYIPAPKANYARVVINGESWGAYINIQQFNSDFTRDFFQTTEGARWKVPANMRGGSGSLQYLGDAVDSYKSAFEIKSKDDPQSWKSLIALCKTLNQEPPKTLETALSSQLDIEGALRFLALDLAVVNEDGYWTRASDYSIYCDPKGRFHVLPYDTNEAFGAGGGMGGGRGGGGRGGGGFGGPGSGGFGGGASLNPLVNANDSRRPLASRLLAVPALQTKYLGIVRDIAQKWLDWERLGPIARRNQALIASDVKADTKKLYTFEAFESGIKSLEAFVTARRTFLLQNTEAKLK